MRKFVVASLISLSPMAAFAQSEPARPAAPGLAGEPFTAADAQSVVPALADMLDQNFVSPAIAKRYASALREKLASGGYSSFPDKASFARALTADLQVVAHDGHLRVLSPAMVERVKAGPGANGRGQRPDSFIEKSGWVAPGVAYISYLAFMGDEPTMRATREFLDTHSNAKVLIIDARKHHGGGMREMDLLFSRLFAKKTPLLELDTRAAVDAREGQRFADAQNLSLVPGPDGVVRRLHSAVPDTVSTALRKARIFVLTSKVTGSAGEHFALALKASGRATLIGETTHGAGNYGHPFPLPGGYAAFIPFGTTFDPRTGKGWEGTGVTPNVAVPADQALDEALKRSGVKTTAEAALSKLT